MYEVLDAHYVYWKSIQPDLPSKATIQRMVDVVRAVAPTSLLDIGLDVSSVPVLSVLSEDAEYRAYEQLSGGKRKARGRRDILRMLSQLPRFSVSQSQLDAVLLLQSSRNRRTPIEFVRIRVRGEMYNDPDELIRLIRSHAATIDVPVAATVTALVYSASKVQEWTLAVSSAFENAADSVEPPAAPPDNASGYEWVADGLSAANGCSPDDLYPPSARPDDHPPGDEPG